MHAPVSLLALASLATAAVHESLSGLPFGWTESSTTVDSQQPMRMQVALKYSNVDKLESLLRNVSSPDSSDYGHYLDIEQMNAIFGPSSNSSDAVQQWLVDGGASSVSATFDAVSFIMSVENANALLDTTFKVYTNGEKEVLRTMGYSVPDHLTDHIDLISPTTYFSSLQAHAALPPHTVVSQQEEKRQVSTSCEVSIPVHKGGATYNMTVLGPTCFHELYNTTGYTPSTSSGSNVAFSNFLNQSASYSDLALFEEMFSIPSQNFTVLALINGGVDNQDPQTEMDGEANLDAQNIIGMVQGLPVYTYITGGLPPFIPDLLTPNASTEQNEPYLEYYSYLLSQPNSALPHVISNSYGDHENTVPERYARRVCNMIGMMGLRGRTVLESSGDEGVGAVCLNNEPPNQPQFTPQFPGTCPYVTAVGGTQFLDPEWAWNASSGGFSFYFDQPWYQKEAVQTYLSQYISADVKDYYSSNNYTNFAGRGFPDVAAHSLYP
jgi:tripeptidyl-peptidase I